MERNFEDWLAKFRTSISAYDYYTSFENVYRNTNEFKVELNILNSLIGSQDIETDFLNLLDNYPQVLKAIPILLAKRESEIYCNDEKGSFTYNFKRKTLSTKQYAYFMKETGLFDLISKHLVSNLYDYVLGVNTGLDSNGRKNRGGHLMEDLVESYLKKANLEYYKEMYIEDVESKFNVSLYPLSAPDSPTKRFDFVVKGKNTIYVIECNFYASGGSKLNETARSYELLALEAKKSQNCKFVWFTDGKGWVSARKNLKETFKVLDDMYCIEELEKGIVEEIFV